MLTNSISKRTRSSIGLLAFVALVFIILELLALQKLSSGALFDVSLTIHNAKDHLGPINLFVNNNNDRYPSDPGDRVEDIRRAKDSDGIIINNSRDAQPATPVIPSDAQLKLVRMAKDRGLHNVDDKGPILEILFQAGIEIENKDAMDQETLDLLPTWTQVQNLYGSEPKIYGLERCEEFRNAVEPTTRFFGIAGTFNTGTNLIADLMEFNCQITERMEVYGEKSKGVRWQVPWGKHMMARYRDTEHSTEFDSDVPHENILPLVSIRDPYSWMQSMCRHKYAANWPHNKKHCPNLIATEADINILPLLRNLYGPGGDDDNQEKLVPVRILHAKDNVQEHLSLAHYYSEWYEDYFKADYPRIIVRFEDLLFYGEKVTRTVCKCGGGVPRPDNRRSGYFTHVSESAKKGATAHGARAERTNLVGALIKYGSFANRTNSMTKDDLIAARRHLDPKIMEAFGYLHPALPVEEME
jgi:hypothetical protein